MNASTITRGALAILTIGTLTATSLSEEKEVEISMDKVPAAAAAALKKAAGASTIDKVVKEGGKEYEASFKVDGKTHEVSVNPDGKIIGSEDEIALSDAPEAVRTAIGKAAGSGKVVKVEKAVDEGKTTFEATIETNGKKHEVTFTAAGKSKGEGEK